MGERDRVLLTVEVQEGDPFADEEVVPERVRETEVVLETVPVGDLD